MIIKQFTLNREMPLRYILFNRMIVLLGIVGGFFIFFSCYSWSITTFRNKFKRFYCPPYSNFLLAHAYEIAKSKRTVSDNLLKWSKESGDDTFVLFSSWRVHLHVIDVEKIRFILCNKSILKSKQSALDKFEGINVLGNRSLLTDPGTESWAKKRKTFDPFFHFTGLVKSFDQLVCISNDLCESIRHGEATNLTKLMQRHVSFVIAQVVMEVEDRQLFYHYSGKISNIFSGLNAKLRNKNTFWIPWTHKEMKNQVLEDIEEVRCYLRDQVIPKDLDKIDPSSALGAFLSTNVKGDQLYTDDLINDMITFFFAGIDTSMHTINFAFFELLRNKDVLSNIEVEIAEVFGEEHIIAYDKVKQLRYLDSFIREVLRIHPIVSTVSRTSGESGFDMLGSFVPENATVHVNIECVQKSEKFWRDPLVFDVERWNNDKIVPFSYIPFSGGNRSCIGKGLALLEIKVFISSILRKFTIDYEKSVIEDISTSQVITNKLAKDLHIKFKLRN